MVLLLLLIHREKQEGQGLQAYLARKETKVLQAFLASLVYPGRRGSWALQALQVNDASGLLGKSVSGNKKKLLPFSKIIIHFFKGVPGIPGERGEKGSAGLHGFPGLKGQTGRESKSKIFFVPKNVMFTILHIFTHCSYSMNYIGLGLLIVTQASNVTRKGKYC